MADDKRAASASSASSSAPPSPQTPPPAAGAHSAADAAPLAGARQGRVLPDFRTTATLIGPPCGGRSTVFRRLMAELQQASDVSESEAGAVGLLRVDYDGRRALIKLSDASSDSLENFLCEGREHRNPFRACVFVLVASLRCDGLMDAPVCSDGAAEAASAPPKAAAQEEEEEEGPQSLPPASAVAASEAERQLLLSLDEWHARASKHCATPRPSFLVVATAMDLPASKRLSPAPVAAWAKGKGALFASTGLNFAHGLLQQPFSRAVAAALDLHTYPVMRRGYLVKQGAWMRNWKRRLFVLEREGRLRYYAEDRDEAKGTIDVTAARRLIPAEECNTSWPPKADMDACFGIELANRTYYFVAQDAAHAKAWQRDLASLSTSPDFCLPLETAPNGAEAKKRPAMDSLPSKQRESRVDAASLAPASS